MGWSGSGEGGPCRLKRELLPAHGGQKIQTRAAAAAQSTLQAPPLEALTWPFCTLAVELKVVFGVMWCVGSHGLPQAVTLVWENGEDDPANSSTGASLTRGLAALGAGRLPSPAARVGAFCAALAWTGLLFLLAGSVARPAGTGPGGRERTGPKTIVVLVREEPLARARGGVLGWQTSPPATAGAVGGVTCTLHPQADPCRCVRQI